MVGPSIYAVPSHSKHVLRLTPDTEEFRTLKSRELEGKFKWLRGQQEEDALYCIPAWADTVLKIIPSTGEVSEISLPEEPEGLCDGPWKWHGSARGGDGNIYTIPANAEHVLKISPRDDTIKVTKGGPFVGRNKWYGGIAAPNGCVYGVPYAAETVLKIDPFGGENGSAFADTFGSFPKHGKATHQWHGGVLSPVDNNIYCFPSHGESVLKIDTDMNEAVQMDQDRLSGRYKWLGGCVDDEGNVYGVPSDATSVLKIYVRSGKVLTFGQVSSQKNKWQGAVKGKNGKLYCLPANAQQVLVIDTYTSSIELIGNLPPTKNKYQGGFLSSHDNCIYAIPECASQILKIDIDRNECMLLDLSVDAS